MALPTFTSFKSKQEAVAVVGLGYVGLPLAVALSKHFKVIGFDVNEKRINELKNNQDHTGEVSEELLSGATIAYTTDKAMLKNSKFIIVAVPTPIDKGNMPDLELVRKATAMIGANMSAGSVVVYESTVYPGVTEEICLPILEKESGLKGGQDFKIGYSPERINPGDKEHTIDRVIKVVSGMDSESLELVAEVYGAITQVHRAASIKVAEAAKVIENTQRDLNIALMNELAIIFNKLGISTHDVLAAAGTKWNFLKFYPGLVGGHCIGVDPYYLTYKAQMLGYQPEVILAGRHINDAMGPWIIEEIIKTAVKLGKNVSQLRVLVGGITFKENVPDVRNSKVYDMIKALQSYGIECLVHDPIADPAEVEHEYGVKLVGLNAAKNIDLLIIAVAHDQYKAQSLESWQELLSTNVPIIADIKNVFKRQDVESLGIHYWGL